MNAHRESCGQSSNTRIMCGLLLTFVLGLLVGAFLETFSSGRMVDDKQRCPDDDIMLGFLREATTSGA